MTVEDKEKFLMMVSYSAKDVMILTGYAKSKVTIIMNECKLMFGGIIRHRPNAITSKSFWLWNGSSIEEEYRLLGIAKGYNKI